HAGRMKQLHGCDGAEPVGCEMTTDQAAHRRRSRHLTDYPMPAATQGGDGPGALQNTDGLTQHAPVSRVALAQIESRAELHAFRRPPRGAFGQQPPCNLGCARAMERCTDVLLRAAIARLAQFTDELLEEGQRDGVDLLEREGVTAIVRGFIVRQPALDVVDEALSYRHLCGAH